MKIEDIVNILNGSMPNYHVDATSYGKRVYVKGRVEKYSMFSIFTYTHLSDDSSGLDLTWFVHINRMVQAGGDKYEIEIPDTNTREFFILLDRYLVENKEILTMIEKNGESFNSMFKKNDLYKSNIRDLKINQIL
jgi:hypothetical protein